MLRALVCLLAMLALSACVSEPKDPSFIGARAFDAEEAAKTRISLGLTYLKNGNFSQAKFNLDKALEFAPRNGQAHFAMAFYYQQVDEAVLAEDSYEKALAFSRNDPDIVNSYGAFLCREGKYEKAKEYFLKAVNSKNYVSTAETYENLAICSQNQGKNQEAIEFFTSALNHQPTRPQSLYLLTRLYVEEQQWEAAKRTLFKYERNAQVSAETLYMQYQIAQGLGDQKTAVGYGEILKSMFPEHSNTQAYLAQMGKFKPSATVTRKIRTQTSAADSKSIDPQMLVNVLSESETDSPESDNAQDSRNLDADTEPSIIIIDTTKPTIDASEPSATKQLAQESELLTPEVSEEFVARVDTTVGQQSAVIEPTTVDAVAESIEDPITSQKVPASNGLEETSDAKDSVDAKQAQVLESADVLPESNLEDALAAVFESDESSTPVDVLIEPRESIESDFHIVQAQENLYRISMKYNVRMSALLEWNNLTDASAIRVGKKLRVRDPNNNE